MYFVEFLFCLVLGYTVGRYNEKKHIHSIIEREKALSKLLVFSDRRVPHELGFNQAELVSGSVVISIDYYKRIGAFIRLILGGRLKSYESLLERARREAILRMKEDAKHRKSAAIFNVKVETARITHGKGNRTACVEVLAYGTALRYAKK